LLGIAPDNVPKTGPDYRRGKLAQKAHADNGSGAGMPRMPQRSQGTILTSVVGGVM